MVPGDALLERFRADLDPLAPVTEPLGIAVSGGPDSLALLLLAAAARPGMIEAATVDHGLRAESAGEAEIVARVASRLGVPHTILAIDWDIPPASALQEQARRVRYGALGEWAEQSGIGIVATAHHLDDQAETLLMRLARGAGVRGLSGMRPLSPLPGGASCKLARPLLSWRRAELEDICAEAGLKPVLDPSNAESRFERVRVRQALGRADWLDPEAIARSAANLAAADEAVDWAAATEWDHSVRRDGHALFYRPSDAPDEILRRVVARAVSELASEGAGEELRGRELDRLLATLRSGGTATLRGVRCSGSAEWRFTTAPVRQSR